MLISNLDIVKPLKRINKNMKKNMVTNKKNHNKNGMLNLNKRQDQ